MIKFFRKIRQQLLAQNKVRNYLLYAVGEVVLVVIGILIALSINNANEMRKNEKEINSILKQIRSELVTNIQEADVIIKDYMRKDSLIYIVMTDKVTYDDYKNKTIEGLTNLTTYYYTLNIQNDGFTSLMNHVKSAPKSLDPIITDLKQIFVNDYKSVELTNKLVEKAIDKHFNWLKYNTTWIANGYFNNRTLSDEEINFYLNNSYYKNIVSEFFILGLENNYQIIATIRYHSYKCYQKITSYLKLDEDSILNPSPFQQDVASYEMYLGNFKSETDTITIFTENNQPVFQFLNDENKYAIIPNGKASFIPSPAYFYYVNFDENGKVTGLTKRFGDRFKEYTKID